MEKNKIKKNHAIDYFGMILVIVHKIKHNDKPESNWTEINRPVRYANGKCISKNRIRNYVINACWSLKKDIALYISKK